MTAAVTESREQQRYPGTGLSILPGILALGAALLIAVLIHGINAAFAAHPRRAEVVVLAILVVLVSLPPIAALLARRDSGTPSRAALLGVLSVTVIVAAISADRLIAEVTFPADFLIWSESDFVNDILKLRVGYPLYTAEANNESFTYPPGAQALTFALSALIGQGDSVIAYRAIQVVFTTLAAVIALLCCRSIMQLAGARLSTRDGRILAALALPALFILATNGITNPFAANLHNDALTQLLTVTAFWVLLRYAATRDRRLIIAMALIPAIGFLAKQSMAIWVVFYAVFLLGFDRPRSVRRLAVVVLGGALAVVTVVGFSYLLWGEPFFYWTFTVLAKHGVVPTRGMQHMQEAWAFFGAGLLGGLVLLRAPGLRALSGPWVIWLLLLFAEAYTSGIAWMLNHMGPGSLIAGSWLLAAFAKLWTEAFPEESPPGSAADHWTRPALAAAAAILALFQLHDPRIPRAPIPEDATRYVRQIEQEFSSQDPRRVLLDVGTWVYLDDRVIMKDRAPSIGERGLSQTGNFSDMLQRLREKRYSRILVRNYGSGNFWYDHQMWAAPSGIRRTLSENYQAARTIPGVRGDSRYLFRDITVLEPRIDERAPERGLRSGP